MLKHVLCWGGGGSKNVFRPLLREGLGLIVLLTGNRMLKFNFQQLQEWFRANSYLSSLYRVLKKYGAEQLIRWL